MNDFIISPLIDDIVYFATIGGKVIYSGEIQVARIKLKQINLLYEQEWINWYDSQEG